MIRACKPNGLLFVVIRLGLEPKTPTLTYISTYVLYALLMAAKIYILF